MPAQQSPSPELLALIDANGLSSVIEMVASYCAAESQKTNVAAQAHLADADRQSGRRLTIAGHKRGYEYAQIMLQLRGVASQCKKHDKQHVVQRGSSSFSIAQLSASARAGHPRADSGAGVTCQISQWLS